MSLVRPFSIKRVDGWHVVLDGNGKTVSAPRTTRAQAVDLVEELTRRALRKTRACMCCGVSFVSEGPHNRLCNPCRGQGTSLPPEAAIPSRNRRPNR